MSDITKGDVDVSTGPKDTVDVATTELQHVVIQTYRCPGNSSAALRCAERDVNEKSNSGSGKYVGLNLQAFKCEDGEEIYMISWYKE